LPERSAPTLTREVTRAFRVPLVSGLVMLCASGAALGWYLGINHPAINRGERIVQTVNNAHVAMINEETALRAFVATGDRGFLDPYRQAAPALSKYDKTLERVANGSSLAHEIIDFRLAQERWNSTWAHDAIAPSTRDSMLSPSGEIDRTKLQAFFAGGKQEFDGYRAAEQQLVEAADDHLAKAKRETAIALSTTFLLLLVGALASVAATVRRRRQLSAAVVDPINELSGLPKP
jgi:CHASE3 domain sensor protein